MSTIDDNKTKEYACYDTETKNFIMFMCKKGCKYYDNGCTKARTIRECAKQGLKNKD